MKQRLINLTKKDIIVIGGGIIGAGIAREARLRGLSVALFEKGDFASGTSSKTSCLIHGGIRYLEQGEFRLVYEAIQERFILSRLAPHLVTPLSFLFPIYQGGRKAITIRIGMMLYDLFAGSKSFGRHRFFSKDATLKLEPNLSPNGLLGAAQFWDCQMDDARLCLSTLLSAEADGAEIFRDTQVIDLIQNNGEITGVRVKEIGTGDEYCIQGAVIINATGSWTDTVRRLETNRHAERVNNVRPTKGIHIVLSKLTDHAIVLSNTDKGDPASGHIFFVIPWQGFSLIGTTDTDYYGSLDRVLPVKEEIESLLSETAPFLPSIRKTKALACFAGLRPLINSHEKNPWEMSRRERIEWTDGGMLQVYGGKFTLFRKIAIRVIDTVIKQHPTWKRLRWRPDPEPPIHGGAIDRSDALKVLHPPNTPGEGVISATISAETASHLIGAYGTYYQAVIDCAEGDADLLKPLTPLGYPLLAEVIYTVRHEHARHLSDFMLRRTRLAHGPYRASIPLIEAIANKMGSELQWGPEAIRQEYEAYRVEIGIA